MAAARRELGLLLRAGHGSLFVGDRRGRFKGDTKINFLAIADPALHAPGIICGRPDFTAAHFKWVVMLRAAHARGRKPGTNLKSFGRGYAHHRFCQVCFKLVKNRFTESGRDAANNAFNHATN